MFIVFVACSDDVVLLFIMFMLMFIVLVMYRDVCTLLPYSG